MTLVTSILDELVEISCKEVSWFKGSLEICHLYYDLYNPMCNGFSSALCNKYNCFHKPFFLLSSL